MIKIWRKFFRPKWSFVKSIPVSDVEEDEEDGEDDEGDPVHVLLVPTQQLLWKKIIR
jgi:hypothetical protein